MSKDGGDGKGGDSVVRPDFKTRFTSETAPRQGRKRGTRNRKTIKAAVDERLDKMFDQAAQNIETAIEGGCKKTSIWFVEHIERNRGTRIEAELLAKVSTSLDSIEDIERVSRQGVLEALAGELTFEELNAVQQALSRHSALASVVELKNLREELAQLRGEVSGGNTEKGMGHAPAWGRLIDRTSRPEDDDDDDDDGISTEGRAS